MPSPALAKLEQLPRTPLSSNPNSPNRSQPGSRRGSSSASSLKRPSMVAGAASSNAGAGPSGLGPGAALPAGTSASSISSSSGTNLHPLSTINGANSNSNSNSNNTSTGAGSRGAGSVGTISDTARTTSDNNRDDTAQAVNEEHAGLHATADTTARVEKESALASDSSSSGDDTGGDDASDAGCRRTRTGHKKLRQGSRRLSRMSSTLGGGTSAHWRKPEASSSASNGSSGGTTAKDVAPGPATAIASASELSQPDTQDRDAATATAIPAKSPILPKSASLPSTGTVSSDSSAKPDSKREKEQPPPLSPIEQAKKSAARRAVDAHIRPEHTVIGIGSGSTVPYVVERILEMGEQANRKRWVSTRAVFARLKDCSRPSNRGQRNNARCRRCIFGCERAFAVRAEGDGRGPSVNTNTSRRVRLT